MAKFFADYNWLISIIMGVVIEPVVSLATAPGAVLTWQGVLAAIGMAAVAYWKSYQTQQHGVALGLSAQRPVTPAPSPSPSPTTGDETKTGI